MDGAEGTPRSDHRSRAGLLRYYYLGANWRGRVEHVGAKPAADFNGPLIV